MRTLRPLPWVFVGCWLLASCAPGDSAGVPCNSDEECASSEVCVEGGCRPGVAGARVDAGPLPRDDAGAPPLDAGTAAPHDGGTQPDGPAPDRDGGDGGDGGLVDAGGDSGVDGGVDGGFDAGFDGGVPEGCARAGGGLVVCAAPLARDDAQASCESVGLTLVEITDDDENGQVSAIQEQLGAKVWIGLTDREVEGLFRWDSGAALVGSHFDDGEPNDSGGEDCVELRSGGGWNDISCAVSNAYVCAAPSPPATLSEPYCLANPAACACDTVVYAGNLYLLCRERRSFLDVAGACDAHGMAPIKLESSDEAAFLRREAALFGRSYWSGFGDPDSDGQHRFHDGDDADLGLYQGDAESGDCGLIDDDGIVPTSCTEARGYACEAALPFDVAADCTPLGNGHLACTTARSFDEARAVCQRAGMDLVVVDDEAENQLLLSLLGSLGSLWLGFSDRDVEGIMRAVTGAPIAYADFSFGEPSNGFLEHCGELRELTAAWNDGRCGTPRRFVCEPADDIPAPPPSGVLCLTQPALCPCEHRAHDGVLYSFCPGVATWSEARRTCAALGMQMLEPSSVEADAFVRAQLNALPEWNGTWLGLNDIDGEGSYRWPSGAAPSFTSWADGQPSNTPSNGVDQDCAEYNLDLENRWNDAACNLRRRTACQAEIPLSPTCADLDRDGFGVGCALGPDCDDEDASVNPAALDICNSEDDDCSGAADDDPVGCSCAFVSAGDGADYWICDERVSWYAARAQCRAYGAELAVPDDEAEDALIGGLLVEQGVERGWIGVSDFWTEGSFESVTREPLSFTRWDVGEPSTASEDCVEWRASGWHDLSCTSTTGSICELP